ncbi:hypothetical protein ACFFVB_03615 [Formosa undariae]|uniref:Uncharacterized protein n=1 Tax=Formosa undariae TaxID=1325436 RepID=A0ABV5EY92_9FLAO
MDSIWIIIAVIAIFLSINFLYFAIMKSFVKESLGKKWLRTWGNKMYFWQSSIYVSTGVTVMVVYFLKLSNVMSF